MLNSKIKTFVGLILGLSLVVPAAIIFSNGQIFSKLHAQNNYFCYGAARVETNEAGEYIITHVGGDATEVTIPSEINGVPVTYISADAFDDCRDTLTSITIDGSIPVQEGTFSNMENVLDVTFTGDATEINYGHIFENTTIGTITIPGTVTSVSEETFYGVVDTTTLIYEGSFDNFWGTNGSDGIFGSLWDAFKVTNSSEYPNQPGSMPTNIIVDSTTYHIPSDTDWLGNLKYLTSNKVCYFNSKNKEAFGYKNNNYYKNSKNI